MCHVPPASVVTATAGCTEGPPMPATTHRVGVGHEIAQPMNSACVAAKEPRRHVAPPSFDTTNPSWSTTIQNCSLAQVPAWICARCPVDSTCHRTDPVAVPGLAPHAAIWRDSIAIAETDAIWTGRELISTNVNARSGRIWRWRGYWPNAPEGPTASLGQPRVIASDRLLKAMAGPTGQSWQLFWPTWPVPFSYRSTACSRCHMSQRPRHW